MENGWWVVTKSPGIVPHLERAHRAFSYFPVIEFFPVSQNLTPWDLSRRNVAVYFLVALRFRVSGAHQPEITKLDEATPPAECPPCNSTPLKAGKTAGQCCRRPVRPCDRVGGLLPARLTL